jgi:hypothetical protein
VLESEESDEDVSTALTTAKRERRFVTTVTDWTCVLMISPDSSSGDSVKIGKANVRVSA